MISNFAAICSFFKFGMSPTKSVCYYLRFNEAETNGRIARNLDIQLISRNCFAIYFQQSFSYVCSDIS